MANITQDENNTATEDLVCGPRLFGIEQKIIFSAFNISLSISAFLGNVVIIIALQKPSSLHSPSKLLLGCLASTDLCAGLVSQPLRVIYLMSPDRSKTCYYAKTLSNGIGFIFCTISLLTMTAISVDRLFALTLGLRYIHVVTLRRVWILVVILWFSTISTAFPVSFFYSFPTSDYIICTTTFLGLITSVYCYAKIYCILRRHQAQLNHQGQPHEGRRPLNMSRYRKTVSSALWVQVTLVICYLPFGIVVAIFAITGWNTPGFNLAWEASVVAVLFNSSLNPLIYSWKIKEVRQAVKDTIRQCCCFLS